MGIESTHPLYDETKPKWTRVRDAFLGSDEIKTKGEVYLPKLGSQDKDQYEAYVLRAMYVNAIKNTVQGLVGAVMRIDPVIEAPDRVMELAEDITGTGVSLNDFISNMLSEQLLMGRQGVLVDRTDSLKNNLDNQNQEEVQPFYVHLLQVQKILNYYPK